MISQDDAREFVETMIRHFKPSLTEWEDGFVHDVLAQLDAGRRPLSTRQLEVVDQVMERCSRNHR